MCIRDRVDDVVEVPATGRDVWMGEFAAILLDLGVRRRGRIAAVIDLLAKENLDRALWTHHRNLRGRPGDVEIAANVFGRHDVVRSTIRLARDHGELGDCLLYTSDAAD